MASLVFCRAGVDLTQDTLDQCQPDRILVFILLYISRELQSDARHSAEAKSYKLHISEDARFIALGFSTAPRQTRHYNHREEAGSISVSAKLHPILHPTTPSPHLYWLRPKA